jgi:hypothetical protein
VLVSYYAVERPALRLKRRFQPAGEDRQITPKTLGSQARLSRRNLLPVLGMSSVAVATLATYVLIGRLYPRPVLAVAVTPVPELGPAATLAPPPTPTPTLPLARTAALRQWRRRWRRNRRRRRSQLQSSQDGTAQNLRQ